MKKTKKEAKKLRALGITPKRIRKDAGIPNIYPYKEEVLNALERKENMDKD